MRGTSTALNASMSSSNQMPAARPYLTGLRIRASATEHILSGLPAETKDPAALYQSDPGNFAITWERLAEEAQPWVEHAKASKIEERAVAKDKAARLLAHENVLAEVVTKCRELGVIGEVRLVQLAYLVFTTRVLDRIVSLIVKGPSSAGKSFVMKQVLALFPDSAFVARSSLSERALIYSDQSLSNRMLVLYEAAGMSEGFLTYIVRSLLSEGRIVYETVEKVGGRLQGRLIEKEGPTGLILTTTELSIDPENETRCLSVPATDTPEQTAAIMRRQAMLTRQRAVPQDLTEWHALQTYIGLENVGVVVPFAEALAALIKPAAIRLRRDFPTLLALIKAHALLHQGKRRRNEDGALIAELDDYMRVRRLVAGLIDDAAGAAVPQNITQTCRAVAELIAADGSDGHRRVRVTSKESVSISEIAKALSLDHSTVWRRVRDAMKRGYLKNLEDKKGHPARIAVGEKIGDDASLLPGREALIAALSHVND